MAKNSADYWRDREAAQRKKDIVDQMAYNREIRRIYQSTLDNVQKEIDAFYGRYAKKEGITLAEAKRRVSRIDMEAYERKAKRYVRERDFSPQANEEMRLYNLTMKVNRLEMLKANIGLELVRGFDDLNRTFDEKLTRHATGEFERLAGILGDSVRNNEELAHAIVNASFHNATYSDRIWAYQDLLRDEIGKQVQTGLLQGRNSMELARAVQKRFDVSRSDAERLMMTEMRRVRTEVAKQSYEQNGNTEYQFLALGGNPCNDCADLDGKVFPVKEMMPGTNAPPMHPRCLCSTAPYWDEAKFQEWLDSGAAADGVPWAEFDGQEESAYNLLSPFLEQAKAIVEQSGNNIEKQLTMGVLDDILDEKDMRAIHDYMSSGVAYPLNYALRTGEALSPRQQEIKRALDVALSKLPDYKGTLYRSLASEYMDESESAKFWETHQVGNIVHYPAYTSSCKEIYDTEMDILLVINAKRGKDISSINEMELEVIFKRGSLFEVTRIENGVIYMEEI